MTLTQRNDVRWRRALETVIAGLKAESSQLRTEINDQMRDGTHYYLLGQAFAKEQAANELSSLLSEIPQESETTTKEKDLSRVGGESCKRGTGSTASHNGVIRS